MNKKTKKVLIVIQAFGVPWNIWSNLKLAEIALRQVKSFDDSVEVYIYTQLDVQFDSGEMVGIKVIRIKEKEGVPPSTICLMESAVEFAIKNEIKDIYLVCAGWLHVFRCYNDLKDSIDEVGSSIKLHICSESLDYFSSDWVKDRLNTQFRTRSLLAWYCWEIPIRILYFLSPKWYKKIVRR